jgi:chromosome segregation ATPase
MTDQEILEEVEEQPESSSEGSWMGRFILGLARLFLVALLGIALGVGLYLGVPALLRAWMEPVEANSAQILQLEEVLDRLEEQQGRALDGMSERIAGLEGDSTAQQEMLSELDSQTTLLGEDLEDIESQLDRVESLSDQLESLAEDLAELQLEVGELAESEPEPGAEISALQAQLQRLQAMTLISRARLELLRGNYGLAEENLAEARAVFDDQLLAQGSSIIAVIERLDLAIESLPETPTVAAQDLEAAWRLLIEVDKLDSTN